MKDKIILQLEEEREKKELKNYRKHLKGKIYLKPKSKYHK